MRLGITFHDDAACASPLFRLDVEGPYDLGPKSMERRDATTARFDVRKSLLTPLTQGSAEAFDEANCAGGAWKVGEAQEVTQFGCLDLVPTQTACPVEYDIVKIENGKLYLGDRSRGLCVPNVYPKRFAPTPLEPQS